MDDTHTIMAAGAGAVSKLCGEITGVRRVFNYKYPYEYLENFSEVLKRKGDVYAADY
jgi:oxygen-independent coproporphyrinogen-3 oxidase